MSYLIPEYPCEHQGNIMQFIILQQNYQGQRLLCNQCDMNEKVNLFYISNIFEFAEECKSSEMRIEEEIQKIIDRFQLLQQDMQQQQKGLSDQINQLISQFQTEPKILQNDPVSICLEKKNQTSKEELLNMANKLEKLLNQKNKLQTNRYAQLDGLIEIIKQQLNKLEQQTTKDSVILTDSSLIQSSIFQEIQFCEMNVINIQQQKYITAVQFNKNNTIMAIGGSILKNTAHHLSLYQQKNDQYTFLLHLNGPVSNIVSLCFDQTDDSLYSAEKNQILHFKQTKNKWYIAKVIEKFQCSINCLEHNVQQNLLAIGSDTIHLFNSNNEQAFINFQILQNDFQEIKCINFSNSNQTQFLIAATKDLMLLVYEWNEKISKYQILLKQKTDDQVYFVKFYKEIDIYMLLKNNYSVHYLYQPQLFDYDKLSSKFPFKDLQIAEFNENTLNLFIRTQDNNNVIVFFVSNKNHFYQHKQQIKFKANQIFVSKDGQKIALINEVLKIYSIQKA